MLNFLDASPFEQFCYVIKRFLKMTLFRRCRTLEETAKAVFSSVPVEERKSNTGGGICKEKLVKDGVIIDLVTIATSTLASLDHIENNFRVVLDL